MAPKKKRISKNPPNYSRAFMKVTTYRDASVYFVDSKKYIAKISGSIPASSNSLI